MRAIIIGNGNIDDFSIVRKNLKPKDIIICCDGGLRYSFEEGLMPHYIIGDLDSALPQMVQFFEMRGVNFKKFDTKKDFTDMELCIDFVIGLGVFEILIFGATGSRIDHTLANMNLLIKTYSANIDAKILDSNNEIMLIGNEKEYEVLGEIESTISLIPITNEVFVDYAIGFEYELEKFILTIGKSIGVSNKIKSKNCKIKINSGYLLLIKAKD